MNEVHVLDIKTRPPKSRSRALVRRGAAEKKTRPIKMEGERQYYIRELK